MNREKIKKKRKKKKSWCVLRMRSLALQKVSSSRWMLGEVTSICHGGPCPGAVCPFARPALAEAVFG